jgi:DNA-binding NarL/FixJ family response regulator
MTAITLLIVDDHPVFRQGLRDVFAADPQTEVVGEAADGQLAVELVAQLRPDVVLMDINLPGASGLQATNRLLDLAPETKVVMITGYDEPEQIFHSLRAGASGFCSKDTPPEILMRTVHSVVAGDYMIQGRVLTEEEVHSWLEKRLDRFGKRPLPGEPGAETVSLSPREMEILELICQGASNKSIARQLGISYQTVKNHVTAVLQKLGVKDRTQAVLYALKQEWFELDSNS